MVNLFSDLIQRHKCSLLNESDNRKSLNVHVLENLVLCAEVRGVFRHYLPFYARPARSVGCAV